MLLLLTGLNEAHSNYACLWCNIHKKDRYNTLNNNFYVIAIPLRYDMSKTDLTERTIEGLMADKMHLTREQKEVSTRNALY